MESPLFAPGTSATLYVNTARYAYPPATAHSAGPPNPHTSAFSRGPRNLDGSDTDGKLIVGYSALPYVRGQIQNMAQETIFMYVGRMFTGAALVVALVAGTPARSDPYALPITEASSRYNIPPSWISAVIERESGGDAQAVSPKGAIGLMQLMPDTYADMRVREGLGNNPYDTRDNILAGTAYLRTLFERYGMPGALAAYNAGPGRYDRHRAGRIALPAETVAYVNALAPRIGATPAKTEARIIEQGAESVPGADIPMWDVFAHSRASLERASVTRRSGVVLLNN